MSILLNCLGTNFIYRMMIWNLVNFWFFNKLSLFLNIKILLNLLRIIRLILKSINNFWYFLRFSVYTYFRILIIVDFQILIIMILILSWILIRIFKTFDRGKLETTSSNILFWWKHKIIGFLNSYKCFAFFF